MAGSPRSCDGDTSMIGTISPSLNLEEAHGFYDAQITSQGFLWVDGSGVLEIDGDLPVSELFGTEGITDYGWGHQVPGSLVSFKPTLNIAVQMSGSGSLDANFTVTSLTLPGKDMIQTSSTNMGDFSGSIWAAPPGNGNFRGAVTASPTSDDSVTQVVLGLDIDPHSKMHFTVFDYTHDSKGTLEGRDVAVASAEFGIQLNHRIDLLADENGIFLIDAYQPITAQVKSEGVSPSWADVTHHLSPGVSPAVVYNGQGETPPARSPPSLSGQATFTGDFIHCGNPRTMMCLSLLNVSDIDIDLRNDYDGENAAANAEDRLLRKNSLTSCEVPFCDIAEHINPGATQTKELAPRRTELARQWTITPPSGNGFITLSSPYLTGNSGRVLNAANPNSGYFNLQNQYDCVTGAVTDTAVPSRDQAAEHLGEQNLIALGWEFMMTGWVPATTQSQDYRSEFQGHLVPETLMGANGVFIQPWNTWDSTAPHGTHEDPTLSPEREMWDAIGSVRHPEFMVSLQQTINAFKSRMMRGIAAIGDNRWAEFNWDDTSKATGFVHALEALSELCLYQAVINYLNHPTARAPFVASLNRLNDIFPEFDAALARNNLNNGVQTAASVLWREFIYGVVITRTENSHLQYRSFLQRMNTNWSAEMERARAGGASGQRLLQIEQFWNR